MRIKQALKNDVETIKNTLGYECVNVLSYPYYHGEGTYCGVSVVMNKNKSIMLTGTTTQDCNYQFHHRVNAPMTMKKGKYILNGIPEELADKDIKIVLNRTNGDSSINVCEHKGGQETYFEIEEDCLCGIYLDIASGITFNGDIIRPMIRPSYIVDNTYREYKANLDNFLTKKAYTVNLSDNNLASPYSKYATIDITEDVKKYGTPISFVGFDDNRVPALISLRSATNTVLVCSNKATVYIYVVYSKLNPLIVS